MRRFEQPYVEREPPGPVNIQVKLARQAAGGPFEPHAIALINRAAAMLAAGVTRVAEVGCGTGMFATEIVRRYPDALVTASEMDTDTLAWTMAHRAHPRIAYGQQTLDQLADAKVEIVAALEVIEHLKAYGPFLEALARTAPRAIITTPNKNRSAFDAVTSPPAFSEHVREWTAGEFFWVLRVFWARVDLYTLDDFPGQVKRFVAQPDYEPVLRPALLNDTEEPLIASCYDPVRWAGR